MKNSYLCRAKGTWIEIMIAFATLVVLIIKK